MPDKPIAWRSRALTTPPFSADARRRSGFLLRVLQKGETLSLPHSRPMPMIGRRVHELRVKDGAAKATWRIIYRVDADAIVVVEWFDKDTNQTPKNVLEVCKDRLRRYDEGAGRA